MHSLGTCRRCPVDQVAPVAPVVAAVAAVVPAAVVVFAAVAAAAADVVEKYRELVERHAEWHCSIAERGRAAAVADRFVALQRALVGRHFV